MANGKWQITADGFLPSTVYRLLFAVYRPMTTIEQAFNQSVSYYDAWMRKAIPCFDQIFGVAMELLPFADDAPINALDLGAGTGIFAGFVRQRYPHARLELIDLAADMLDLAKIRFAGLENQVSYTVQDYRTLAAVAQFDLVVSSMSIHHLSDADKRALFRRVHTALKPGGVFINLDQIKGQTEAVRSLYRNTWLKQVRAAGAPEDQIEKSLQRRTAFDQDALLVDQLAWLAEAGFTNVDCVYKHYFVGLFFATKIA